MPEYPRVADDPLRNDPLVQRRGGLIEAEVDGELIALHVENGTCYGFNATATRIWGMIAEPISMSALRDRLLAAYDVDPATCEGELLEVLRDLEKDGLVEFGTAPR